MEKVYNMSDGTLMTINMENYSEEEFLVAEIDFLGCNPNSHKIAIKEEVFKKYAFTVLGKFLVAKVAYGDATGHASDETIVGYIPTEQEVRFKRNNQGYLRGVIDGVISKQYASEFCKIFTQANNTRSVSVEMGVEEEECEDGTIAKRFNIMGVTVLGMSVRPSSPGSEINIKRFSEKAIKNNCDYYYKSVWQKLADKEDSELDMYVKNRKTKFAKAYSINTTELKETPWGEVDKTEIRDKVMEASNRSELVKKVYLKVLDGWEDAPSEKLKYPVMELVNNTFYYNRYALASALAYARQHDEADVVSKVLKLYKKFKLAEEGEEENMSKAKFEIEGREAWGDVIKEVQDHEGSDAYVDSIEDDHIIFTVDDVRYRVEADVEVGEDDKTVKADIHWDTKKKDEVQDEDDDEDKDEMSEDDSQDIDSTSDDDEKKDEEEDMEEDTEECAEDADAEECEGCEKCEEEKEECASDESSEEEMSKDEKISELEDIIMQQEKELAELRQYKEEKECAERDFAVQQLLEEIRECVDSETLESLKAEGLACKLSEIDGWKNKAKALAFDKASKKESFTSKWSMAISQQTTRKSTSKWDSIN